MNLSKRRFSYIPNTSHFHLHLSVILLNSNSNSYLYLPSHTREIGSTRKHTTTYGPGQDALKKPSIAHKLDFHPASRGCVAGG